MVVQVISQKIVSVPLKQVRKAVSTAAGTLKTIRNAPLKQARKAVSRAVATLKTTRIALLKQDAKVVKRAAVVPDHNVMHPALAGC